MGVSVVELLVQASVEASCLSSCIPQQQEDAGDDGEGRQAAGRLEQEDHPATPLRIPTRNRSHHPQVSSRTSGAVGE
jgi:hypothetical protein